MTNFSIKMKRKSFIQALAIVTTMLTIVSCVEDDFDIPEISIESPNLDGSEITLGAFSSLYEQALFAEADDLGFLDGNGEVIDDAGLEELRDGFQFTFQNDGGDVFMSGYVISTDESGNFFEELILQDTPENPTVGIRLLIDINPLFTRYEIGRRIFVRLNGLVVGISNGVLTLGIEGGFIEAIPSFDEEDRIIRDVEVATIIPRVIALNELSDELTNLFVMVENAQFNRDDVINANLTYAGEPTDEFDGERTLESCVNNGNIVFSTSTFADFKSLLLPTGRGSVTGVLTRDFFGEVFNFVVNDPSGVVFDQEDRCDPEEVDCGLSETIGNTILFEDFFEDQDANEPIMGNGWTNYIEEGTETWEAFFSTTGNVSLGVSARVGSFKSGDASTIAWLITPQINFDTQDGETLNFMTSNSFANGSTLELLFSSDWDGVPENIPVATWDIVPAAFIVGDDDPFTEWFPSGNVSLDCIEGQGYLGFRYIGSGDANFDGTYELDEIQIQSN